MDDILLLLIICEAMMVELSKGRVGVDIPDPLGCVAQAEELALFELSVGNLSGKIAVAALVICEDSSGRLALVEKAFLEASVVDI